MNKIDSVYHIDICNIWETPVVEARFNEIKNIERFYSKKCNKEILNFIKVIIEKVPKESLNNFYNNINSLEVKSSFLVKLARIQGYYNSITNKVFLDTKTAKNVIYHELLHMASTLYTKYDGKNYSGFVQANGTYWICEGINEGYTELLSNRFFNVDNCAYGIHVVLAQKLEEIIGKDVMEHLYFTSDLYGLVNILKQYSSDEEIEKFLFNMDYTNTQYDKKEIIPNFISRLSEIYQFLINCYAKKVSKNEPSNFQLINQIKDYALSFPPGFAFYGNDNILVMSKNDLVEYINNALKSVNSKGKVKIKN